MPKKYKVRLFKQTGYNFTDVPGSKAALNKNTHEDTEVIMEWQSRVLTHIQVEPTTSFLIEDCDYAMITEVNGKDGDMLYYVGKGIRYLAEGTVVLPLVFDAVGTVLVNNVLKNSIVGGRVARRHTNEENIIPESFVPTRPRVRKHVEIDFFLIGQPGYQWTSYIPLVIASTDLADLASQGRGLQAVNWTTVDGGGVIVPSLPSTKDATELQIATGLHASSGSDLFYVKRPLPQKILYVGDVYTTDDPMYTNDGNNIAQFLRGLGLDSIISSAYSFPTAFYDVDKAEMLDGNPKGFKKFVTKPVIKKFPFPIMGPETANGVKLQNKKTRFLHRRFIVQSVASLSSQLYEAWELILDINKDNPGNNELVALADPSPQGTLFVRPRYIKYGNGSGNPTGENVTEGVYIDGFYRAVPSIPWNAYTLAAEGGEVFMANMDYAMKSMQILNDIEKFKADADMARMNYAVNRRLQEANIRKQGMAIGQQVIDIASNIVGGAVGAVGQIEMAGSKPNFILPLTYDQGSRNIDRISGAVNNSTGLIPSLYGGFVDKQISDELYAPREQLGGRNMVEHQVESAISSESMSIVNRTQSTNLARFSAYNQPPTFLSEAPIGLTSAFIGRYQITMEDIDDEDKLLEDLLFNMEGYQVNETYRGSQDFKKCFNSRAKYNYVQFDQCHVNTPYNGDISAEVHSRLIAGVRVWHDKVSLGAYYQPNPKR